MSIDLEENLVKFEASSSAYDSGITHISGANNMIEQTATVVSVEAGYAWVVPQRRGSGCGGCSSSNACSSSGSTLALMRKDPQKMRVLNPLYARPGDEVVIGMQGEALIIYSLLAYLLPLVGLILAAILGNQIFLLSGMSGELGAVLGGIAGLIGGLRIANSISTRSLHSVEFQPVILRSKEHMIYSAHILPSP